MSYAVPASELTLTDIKNYKASAISAGISRALALGLARTESELVVRSALPHTDFGAGAVGWTAENYITGVIAAAGWGSPFDAGAVPANVPQLAATKVAVFFKLGLSDAAPQIAGLRFRVGAGGASTKGVFFFQVETTTRLEPVVYFSEPIVYDPQDWIYMEAYFVGAVALAERMPLGCFIIEKTGSIVS